MKKPRRHYTAEEKVAILRRHLVDNEAVSSASGTSWGCNPPCCTVGKRELFENGPAAFQHKSRPHHQAEQERIEYLEKKIQTKDEVLAELMAEHIALKKSLGANSERRLGPA